MHSHIAALFCHMIIDALTHANPCENYAFRIGFWCAPPPDLPPRALILKTGARISQKILGDGFWLWSVRTRIIKVQYNNLIWIFREQGNRIYLNAFPEHNRPEQ